MCQTWSKEFEIGGIQVLLERVSSFFGVIFWDIKCVKSGPKTLKIGGIRVLLKGFHLFCQ